MPAKWSSWDSYPRWTPNTITMPCCLQLQWNRLTVLIKSLSQAGGGNGNPARYSCLGNPTDRGAWRATAHGVTKSWTRLSDQTTGSALGLFSRHHLQTTGTHIWHSHWVMCHELVRRKATGYTEAFRSVGAPGRAQVGEFLFSSFISSLYHAGRDVCCTLWV